MNLIAIGQQLLEQNRAAYKAVHASKRVRSNGFRPKFPPTQAQLNSDDRADRAAADAGWLSPLRVMINQPILPKSADSATVQFPATVAINPAILNAITRGGHTSAGRLWLLCRALDGAGRGALAVQIVRDVLTDKSKSSYFGTWRRIRQIVAQGNGIFWERGFGRCRQNHLFLAGAATVAKRLEIGRLARRNVQIPVAELLAGTKRARAAFYAAFHAGRDSNPISRVTIERVTGLCERSQRVYDGMAAIGIQKQANYTLVGVDHSAEGKISAENRAWAHGRGAFGFVDHNGQHGKKKGKYQAVRLPNTYTSSLQLARNGRRRKIARALKCADRLVNKGSAGQPRTAVRLFHRSGRQKQAVRASRQLGNAYLYLQTTQQRHRGDLEIDRGAAVGWWLEVVS